MSKTQDKSISQEILSDEGNGHCRIPIAAIEPNPLQPRKHFDVDKIRELADSIAMVGRLMQSPVVRPKPSEPGKFQLIAGERRLRALRLLMSEGRWSETEVECDVCLVDDQTSLVMAMEENIRRHNLNVIDEAWGFCELEQLGLTQEQIGGKFGLSQGAVSNKIRLLKLPESVRKLIIDNKLSASHGIALASLDGNEVQQVVMADQAVREAWNVKRLEDEVRIYKAEHDRELNPPMFDEVAPAKMAGDPLVQTGASEPPAESPAPSAPESPTEADQEPAEQTDADSPEEAIEAESEASEAHEEAASQPAPDKPAPLPSTPIAKPTTAQSTSKPTLEAAAPENTSGPALFFAGDPKPLTAIVPGKLLEWMQTEGVKAAPALTLYARLHQFADGHDWSAEAVIEALEGRDLAVLETLLAVLSEVAVSIHNSAESN